jgi:hypothetical protein
MGGTGGPLKDRINLIRKWLKIELAHLPFGHPERQPKIFWDRSCTESIREMDAYRYADIKVGNVQQQENPLKKDDHSPEALSRFFGGYFGLGPVRGPRIRKALVRG